jgi:hypothetical protein
MTDTSAITDIPDGFEPHFRKSPLTDPWEPLYSKRTERAACGWQSRTPMAGDSSMAD